MNAGPSSSFPNRDEVDVRHEAVWRFLERAPMPQPDAWFAARTLARCRTDRQEKISFTRIWRWALGGGLGVCLAIGLMVAQVGPVAQVQTQDADQQKNVQEAFEIMASSDNSDTDSSASSASWQDSSL